MAPELYHSPGSGAPSRHFLRLLAQEKFQRLAVSTAKAIGQRGYISEEAGRGERKLQLRKPSQVSAPKASAASTGIRVQTGSDASEGNSEKEWSQPGGMMDRKDQRVCI